MLLDFDEAVTEIWSVDCQHSASSGVIVQVAGSLQCKVSRHMGLLLRRQNTPCISTVLTSPQYPFYINAEADLECLCLHIYVREQ